MLLRDEDSDAFRDWLLPKVEKICDADSAVLADYVVALVSANTTERGLKKNCLESLEDFLQDNTAPFVDDIVKAIKTRAYVSRAPAKANANGTKSRSRSSSVRGTSNTSRTSPPLASRLDPPTGPSARSTISSHVDSKSVKRGRRKRKLDRREASEARDESDSHYNAASNGSRPIKQATGRGGIHTLQGGAAAFRPQHALPAFAPMPTAPGFPPVPTTNGLPPRPTASGLPPRPMSNMPTMPNMANLPPPPPGPMPFEMMNNPMAFMSMMAAMSTNMGGIPPLPLVNTQGSHAGGRSRVGKCYNYHEKGFCALGSLCAFEHGDGDDIPQAVPEYDPDQPSLGSNRTRHGGGKAVKARAPFSMLGPSYDHTNTTLVVEQIPTEKLREKDVRAFFSEFGTVVDVQMHTFKSLAIVKFEDNAAATRAYMSPKAVFENRFVKVYWYKQGYGEGAFDGEVEMGDGDGNDFYMQDDRLNPEEIAKRQAEAQKAFEERRKKTQEADAKAAEIERRLKENDVETKQIRQQLAELGVDYDDGMHKEQSPGLANLALEAENLFTLKEAPSMGRGYGFPLRGIRRGRGTRRAGYLGRTSKSSVKRLDNRPRRLAVSDIEKDTPRDEALRQYLMNVPGCTSIDPHPEQPDVVILTFEYRYQAETFLDNSHQILDVGELVLAWVPNDAFGGLPVSTTTKEPEAAANNEFHVNDDTNGNDDDSDSSATAEEQIKVEAEEDEHVEQDFDVADDADDFL
ncbi:hypothetical protein HBH56_127140 [Parastagonospora nodorum]|uniref:C3H1-type domain-containing protein n=1 Tax=Phaeosphaeria nodorum (strain SN15 / ATCC MYA-4574 / FGSC 10173) TaxID=321614 RepID=A0A7U2I9M3_PHANO|nr:hypothetical protein HBH56_127140 [Parastagonospora nodorum]QRD05767.1 hypothetical protein JI435_060390 [Parastagonospora nodorum SN15]KAH3931366.1 hypothetical protein HBH54_096360 [Parastagonospora nodorum]KAH3970670.1 hypothetical protein HBH51_113850 [Parastagonospora nodorum]KAH3971783.1 hypothetical protein HBH52_156120 [Parastagonospora nodorum]